VYSKHAKFVMKNIHRYNYTYRKKKKMAMTLILKVNYMKQNARTNALILRVENHLAKNVIILKTR